MSHPLENFSISLKNIKCFDQDGSGYFHFAPITLIIGRNNSGKSSIIDFLEQAREQTRVMLPDAFHRTAGSASVFFRREPTTDEISAQFSRGRTGNGIPGDHYQYGSSFVGKRCEWEIRNDRVILFRNCELHPDGIDQIVPDAVERLNRLIDYPFTRFTFARVSAERNVSPEPRSGSLTIGSDGQGLSNVISAFLTRRDLPSAVVEDRMLLDLNDIYRGDAHFTRITCREDTNSGRWEIYVKEDSKGDIPLSQSGSSLKTILIALSFVHLGPIVSPTQFGDQHVFCFEEPENNLHPGLLRRLLDYLARKREDMGFSLIISTHSPVGIDWATRRSDSTVIHVQHSSGKSTCANVLDHKSRASILNDLDIRGSDMLQANGIIWVEGPSDRIYLKHWIDLVSDGKINEGTHYSFMYYGGRVLSHFEGDSSEGSHGKISIMTINRNVALIMDSDRRPVQKVTAKKVMKPRMNINETKRRIKSEIESIGGFVWVTEGKEIENYVPSYIWTKIDEHVSVSDIYCDVPSLFKSGNTNVDKIDLANLTISNFSKADIHPDSDLYFNIIELCRRICAWNSIDVSQFFHADQGLT